MKQFKLVCLKKQCDLERTNWGSELRRRYRMIHPGFEVLKGHWDKEEYAAGYRARLTAIPDFEGAHHCWRVGWEDADTEVLELARHNRVIAEGREDDYSDTWSLLFDAGGDARMNGIPFAEERTAPWKEGWIQTDVNLGAHGLEEQ
jgi:hypothetical protein